MEAFRRVFASQSFATSADDAVPMPPTTPVVVLLDAGDIFIALTMTSSCSTLFSNFDEVPFETAPASWSFLVISSLKFLTDVSAAAAFANASSTLVFRLSMSFVALVEKLMNFSRKSLTSSFTGPSD